jgi:hypothetical protein
LVTTTISPPTPQTQAIVAALQEGCVNLLVFGSDTTTFLIFTTTSELWLLQGHWQPPPPPPFHHELITSDTGNRCRLARRVRQFIGLWLRHHHLLDLHHNLRVVVAAGLLAATTTTTISSRTHHLGHRQLLPPCKKGASIYRSLAPPLFHHLFLQGHHYFTTISDTKGNRWKVECSSWSREEENQKEASCQHIPAASCW